MSTISYLQKKYNYKPQQHVPLDYIYHELLLPVNQNGREVIGKQVRDMLNVKKMPQFLEFAAFCTIVETLLIDMA